LTAARAGLSPCRASFGTHLRKSDRESLARDTDLDLALLCRGDKRAWDGFVARYAGTVRAAVLSVLRQAGRDLNEAPDLVQDVFLRLCKDEFRLLAQYDPARAAPATWLTLIARSMVLDHLRKKQLMRVALEDAPESAVAIDPAEPAEPLKIPPGLLSPRQELVLAMLYERDMDPAEVAAALGIEVQTVRSMHHKALTKLRAFFGEERG
jgi:DNA-directed RNA polymerase specialized sigma24 family protein